jgi:hypothetical protein
MRRSAFISAALHGALLLWVVAAFPTAKLDSQPIQQIPVDLATPAEITKIKAGMVDSKDEAPLVTKPKEKKPVAVKEKAEKSEEPEKTEALPEKKPEPKPEPKLAEAPKKAEPEKVAKAPLPEKKPEPKKPEPKKKAETPKKPAPPKKERDFNADRIAALLNKIPDAAEEPTPNEIRDDAPDTPVRGQSNGTQTSMSVNEMDALRARIAQCWNPPPGGLGADAIVVKLRLQLNEDGTLIGYPSITNNGASAFFQAAADSAVRAVYQCQPYTLPAEKYALWRDMILNFDPSQMYRSG